MRIIIQQKIAQPIARFITGKINPKSEPTSFGWGDIASLGMTIAGLAVGGGGGGAAAAASANEIFGVGSIMPHKGGVVGETKMPFRIIPEYVYGNIPKLHKGGMIDEEITTTKIIPEYVYGNIPKLHGGNILEEISIPMNVMPKLYGKLAPDEFPAILQKGEIVLPKNLVQEITLSTTPIEFTEKLLGSINKMMGKEKIVEIPKLHEGLVPNIPSITNTTTNMPTEISNTTTKQTIQRGTTINIIMENPTFQDLETQRAYTEQMTAILVNKLAPNAIVNSYENDGRIRKIIRKPH